MWSGLLCILTTQESHREQYMQGLAYVSTLSVNRAVVKLLVTFKCRSFRFHIRFHFLNFQRPRRRPAESYTGTPDEKYYPLCFSLSHFCTSSVTPFPSLREAQFPFPINLIIHISTNPKVHTHTRTHS